MIQEEDDKRIQKLQARLGIKTKVQVVREALRLLEQDAQKAARVQRWRRAAKMAADSSREILLDFSSHSRLRKG